MEPHIGEVDVVQMAVGLDERGEFDETFHAYIYASMESLDRPNVPRLRSLVLIRSMLPRGIVCKNYIGSNTLLQDLCRGYRVNVNSL